jgi:hypothetical protein
MATIALSVSTLLVQFMDGHNGTVHILIASDSGGGYLNTSTPVVQNPTDGHLTLSVVSRSTVLPWTSILISSWLIVLRSMLRPSVVVAGLFFVLRWDSSPFHQSHPPVITVVVVKPVGSISCISC